MDHFILLLKQNNLSQAAAWYRVHYNEPYFNKKFKKTIAKIEKKKYYYMITFTLSESHSNVQYDRIEAFIRVQALRPALQIISAEFVRELTKAGRPHWHMAIVTTKLLKKSSFRHYIKTYGSVDISKNRQDTTSEMINYMYKDGIPTKII